MKWKTASAKYWRAIAQALTAATPPMLAAGGSGPAGAELRSALVNWGFNTKQRAMAPENVADTLSWLERNTREVGELSDAALCRKVLAAATTKLDGTRADLRAQKPGSAAQRSRLRSRTEVARPEPDQEPEVAG